MPAGRGCRRSICRRRREELFPNRMNDDSSPRRLQPSSPKAAPAPGARRLIPKCQGVDVAVGIRARRRGAHPCRPDRTLGRFATPEILKRSGSRAVLPAGLGSPGATSAKDGRRYRPSRRPNPPWRDPIALSYGNANMRRTASRSCRAWRRLSRRSSRSRSRRSPHHSTMWRRGWFCTAPGNRRPVIVLVNGPCTSVGVQAIAPDTGLIVMPTGGATSE